MVADVFRLQPGATSVKEIRRLRPIKTVCLAQLDVAPRNFGEGFPGLDMNDYFALDIRLPLENPA